MIFDVFCSLTLKKEIGSMTGYQTPVAVPLKRLHQK